MRNKLLSFGARIYLILVAIVISTFFTLPKELYAQATSSITASLSDFKIDRPNAEYLFTLKVENPEAVDKTVYAVVYGINDTASPPRRSHCFILLLATFYCSGHHVPLAAPKASESDLSQVQICQPNSKLMLLLDMVASCRVTVI